MAGTQADYDALRKNRYGLGKGDEKRYFYVRSHEGGEEASTWRRRGVIVQGSSRGQGRASVKRVLQTISSAESEHDPEDDG